MRHYKGFNEAFLQSDEMQLASSQSPNNQMFVKFSPICDQIGTGIGKEIDFLISCLEM